MSAQNAAMRRDLARVYPESDLSTGNKDMQATIDGLTSLPESDRFVLLYGERGTGKELLARMCHERSASRAGPLVFADLPNHPAAELDAILFGGNNGEGARQSGLVQSANGGSLVLRSAELLHADLQQKFVQLISPGIQPVLNSRVIAFTDELPEPGSGSFSKAFIELFSLCFPVLPLRHRREDIHSLSDGYLLQFVNRYRKRRISFSSEARNALVAYHWPGNIIELKSVIERAVLLVETDEIKPAHLGLGVVDGRAFNAPLDVSLDAYFRYFVLNFQDQLTETELASKLGISRKALWERRQKMDLPRASA